MKRLLSIIIMSALVLSLVGCNFSNKTKKETEPEIDEATEELNEFGSMLFTGSGFRSISHSKGEDYIIRGKFAVIAMHIGNEENYTIIECPEDADIDSSLKDCWVDDYTKADTILFVQYFRTEMDVYTSSNGGQSSETFYDVEVKIIYVNEDPCRYYLLTKIGNEEENKILNNLPDMITSFLSENCVVE